MNIAKNIKFMLGLLLLFVAGCANHFGKHYPENISVRFYSQKPYLKFYLLTLRENEKDLGGGYETIKKGKIEAYVKRNRFLRKTANGKEVHLKERQFVMLVDCGNHYERGIVKFKDGNRAELRCG